MMRLFTTSQSLLSIQMYLHKYGHISICRHKQFNSSFYPAPLSFWLFCFVCGGVAQTVTRYQLSFCEQPMLRVYGIRYLGEVDYSLVDHTLSAQDPTQGLSQLTTNPTNYYQLTNYYVDKTDLLFLHRTITFQYITFHSSALQLFLKLLLSYYETIILQTEKDCWIIYAQKSTFESLQPVFFPSVFIL